LYYVIVAWTLTDARFILSEYQSLQNA